MRFTSLFFIFKLRICSVYICSVSNLTLKYNNFIKTKIVITFHYVTFDYETGTGKVSPHFSQLFSGNRGRF